MSSLHTLAIFITEKGQRPPISPQWGLKELWLVLIYFIGILYFELSWMMPWECVDDWKFASWMLCPGKLGGHAPKLFPELEFLSNLMKLCKNYDKEFVEQVQKFQSHRTESLFKGSHFIMARGLIGKFAISKILSSSMIFSLQLTETLNSFETSHMCS